MSCYSDVPGNPHDEPGGLLAALDALADRVAALDVARQSGGLDPDALALLGVLTARLDAPGSGGERAGS